MPAAGAAGRRRRIWRWLALTAAAAWAVTLVWGLLAFPDAPIFRQGAQYVGKYGAIHPREVFEAYRTWSVLVVSLFVLAFALLIVWNVKEPRS